MNKIKLILLSSLMAFSIIACSSQGAKNPQADKICQYKVTQITIGSNKLLTKNACTQTELSQGLMNIKQMDEDVGMFFIFPNELELEFWMKNTYIPLDIAYINNKLEIVDIHTMKPHDTTSIKSKKLASMAIEVNSGYFKKHNIKIGDKIEIKLTK